MICWWLEEYLFYSEISLSVCFCKVYGTDLPQATHCFCMIFPLPEFYVYFFRYYNQIWQEKVFWRNFKATVNWNKTSKKNSFSWGSYWFTKSAIKCNERVWEKAARFYGNHCQTTARERISYLKLLLELGKVLFSNK